MLSIKYYKGIVLWLDRHCSSCITFSFFSFLLLDHLHLLLVMALWQKNWSSKINLDNLNLFQNAFNVLWEYWQLQGITLGIDLTSSLCVLHRFLVLCHCWLCSVMNCRGGRWTLRRDSGGHKHLTEILIGKMLPTKYCFWLCIIWYLFTAIIFSKWISSTCC